MDDQSKVIQIIIQMKKRGYTAPQALVHLENFQKINEDARKRTEPIGFMNYPKFVLGEMVKIYGAEAAKICQDVTESVNEVKNGRINNRNGNTSAATSDRSIKRNGKFKAKKKRKKN